MDVLNIGLHRKIQHIKIRKANTEYLASSKETKCNLTCFVGIHFYNHRQTKMSITKTSSRREMELIKPPGNE